MFSHIIYKPIAGEAGVSGVDVMRMKDVIISVTGVQQGANGPDAMELITAGQYGQDEKETLLTWQESELTGMEGTKTSLRVQPRGVVLSREGALNTRMEFEEGRKRYFLYETPFGSAEHPPHRQPPRRARRRDRDRLQRGYGRYDRRPKPVFHPRTGAAAEPYQRHCLSQLIFFAGSLFRGSFFIDAARRRRTPRRESPRDRRRAPRERRGAFCARLPRRSRRRAHKMLSPSSRA